MQNEPFFEKTLDGYSVNRAGRGPWDENSVHGRIVIGLLAHEIESRYGGSEFQTARLTVDMYRLPGFAPVCVTTRPVREGKRIRVIDAEFFSNGVSMARATCQLLRRTTSPEGTVWSTPNWSAPRPENIDPPADRRSALGGMWEIRQISGWMGASGPRRVWMREVRELVGGLPLTPFVRAALASDFASPFANAGDKGLGYINSDVTLYIHREMQGQWIGLEVTNHMATEGVAVGECLLYDVTGPIGIAAVTALAQRRNM